MLREINEVFFDVLDDHDLVISEETTADDVEDWDSLTHIQLVVGIEKKFNMRFTSTVIREWRNVGDMCQAIEAASTVST